MARIFMDNDKDIYVNPAQVRVVKPDDSGQKTLIILNDPNTPILSSSKIYDVISVLDEAMKA